MVQGITVCLLSLSCFVFPAANDAGGSLADVSYVPAGKYLANTSAVNPGHVAKNLCLIAVIHIFFIGYPAHRC